MKKKAMFFILLTFFILPLTTVGYAADSSKPIELRFSVHMPPFAPPVKIYQAWCNEVNAETNGKVKVTMYPGGTLMQAADAIAGTKAGIAHIALIVSDMVASERPLTPILQLPFLGLGDWEEGAKMMEQLRQEFPELGAEYSDFKILFREIRTGMGIHTKTLVKVPSDLKGQKVIASGMTATIVNSVGGAAINLGLPDWYTALDRGLADGMFMDIGAVYEVKLYTLLPYHADFARGMNLQLGIIVMNLQTWNSLSPDIQKTMDEVSKAMEQNIARKTVEVNKQYIANMKKEGGHTFTILTDAEAQMWLDAAKAEHERYLAKAEAQGLPARAIYERALELSQHTR
ncbi:TRAP transporter substrate-binding protein DctP [Thermodesulfobacteriota bacterium]